MTATVSIYENEKLLYATEKQNPLLYNIVKGFMHVASKNYGTVLRTIRIGKCVISVADTAQGTVVFLLDDRPHGLEPALRVLAKAREANNMALLDEIKDIKWE